MKTIYFNAVILATPLLMLFPYYTHSYGMVKLWNQLAGYGTVIKFRAL